MTDDDPDVVLGLKLLGGESIAIDGVVYRVAEGPVVVDVDDTHREIRYRVHPIIPETIAIQVVRAEPAPPTTTQENP